MAVHVIVSINPIGQITHDKATEYEIGPEGHLFLTAVQDGEKFPTTIATYAPGWIAASLDDPMA